jgi:hypothetical protein
MIGLKEFVMDKPKEPSVRMWQAVTLVLLAGLCFVTGIVFIDHVLHREPVVETPPPCVEHSMENVWICDKGGHLESMGQPSQLVCVCPGRRSFDQVIDEGLRKANQRGGQ